MAKLFKLFKFKLLIAAILSIKYDTYCLSDMSIRHRHFIEQNVMVPNLIWILNTATSIEIFLGSLFTS